MLKQITLVIALVTLSAASARAAGDLWTTDFEAAKAQAQKENKDLMLDFTGSDWCGWCIKLKEEVFSTDAFKADAPKQFVLVELDFPRQKQIPAATKAQNNKLKDQVGIEGFPTIVLMDAQGRPYAKTGYQEGGPAKYLEHLGQLRQIKVKRDDLLAKAEKATGLEKAKLLDEVITELGKGRIEPAANMPWIEEIVKLDADNKAGLKAKYEGIKAGQEVKARMGAVETLAAAGKFAEAAAAADKVIQDLKPTGEAAQEAYFIKAACQHRAGEKDAAKATLKQALDAAPNGDKAEQIKRIMTSLDK